MKKYSRAQRISLITKYLMENPNKVIGLNYFTELLNSAKSTTSEDIVIIREMLKEFELGNIKTVSGIAGGVKYTGAAPKSLKEEFPKELCDIIRQKERVMVGSFLYITDILSNPEVIQKAGLLLSTAFIDKDVDYVVTVETRGIPLAYEVAKQLGVKLVIARKGVERTEGTTISVNYLSGSSGSIQSMSLARKSINRGSRCIFIDDFMKAGGTSFGITELLQEFECEMVGIGVLVDNMEAKTKIVKDYIALIEYKGIDDDGKVNVKVNNYWKNS